MTPLAELVDELRRAQVRIWAEGDALRYQAPPGRMTPALLAELRSRKPELLDLCRMARPDPEQLAPAPADAMPEMSLAQRRLWLIDRLNGPDPAYNIPLALRLKGELDVGALRRAIATVLRRHDTLRMSFLDQGDTARPVILDACAPPLTEEELTLLPADRRAAEARRRVRDAALQPFDLGQAPLVRFLLLRLDPADHVLLVNIHHIIADGRSIEVLVEELAWLYRANRLGEDPSLPPLRIRYTDFAWHQRRWLAEDVMQRQLGYWRQALQGLPPLLDLPRDRPRPAVFSSAGAAVVERLDRQLVDRLRELAQRAGTTLYTVLLAGLAVVLARHADREDIAIACPATHRTRPELDRLIGFFVNTLVLRLGLAGEPSFLDLLRRAHGTVTQAFAHQDVPFDTVVEALGVERNPGHAPLAQVSLALLSAERTRPRLHGLQTGAFDFGSSVARHDLALEAYESDGALDVFWIHATTLFDTGTVGRMAGRLKRLLEAAAVAPERGISELPLLDAAELRLVTHDWNATRSEPPPTAFVHRAFEAQAHATPDAVALATPGGTLTYAVLNARANALAHRLRERRVGPEARVGICLGRSFELVIAILAVLKAGGAYVPLEPEHPGPRLAGMLQDAGAMLLLADAGSPPDLMAGFCPVLRLDAQPDDAGVRDDNPDVPLADSHLAYVIYTSGSTGQPKGCQIEHRNLMHYLHWAKGHYYAGAEGGSFALFTSLAFDLTVTSLFLPLLRGRTLQVLPQGMPLDAALRHCFAPDSGVDFAKLTPAHLSLLPSLALPHSRVAVAIIGGEQLLPEQVASLRSLNPRMRIFNEYGPTETTVGCVVKEVMPGEERILIGRPIANTQVHVLDPQLRPQPVGVPGELWIGGACVGRGYLGRPDLTAERFMPDPFSTTSGKRLYRSGDLARWLATGELECLGRVDHQVKIRGFRVELGEIEAALARHPAVRQAAVLAFEGAAPARRLVAFLGAPDAPDAWDLRRFLAGRLPDHMVPSQFVVLDWLPLTINGKIDRGALPPLMRPDAVQAPSAAPRTATERLLTGILAQLLRQEHIGIHDDFFQLGGDSILGIQAVSRANQAGLRLTPRDLLHHPTIAGLAAAAETAGHAAPPRATRAGPVPLTPIQRWFFEQDRADPHHFNQAVLLELSSPLQPSLLQQALQHLVRHHDALRLRFRRGSDGWAQTLVEAAEPVPLRCIDLSGLDAAARAAAIEAHAAELQAGFRLDGPLLAFALFDCGRGERPRLLGVLHHLVIDAVSWQILLEDLFTLHRQLQDGGPLQLPAQTTAYQDWAERLVEYAGSAALQREVPLWLDDETGPSLRLPVELTDGPDDEGSSRTVHVALTSAETTSVLRDAPAVYGVRIREMFLVALARALSNWIGPGVVPVDLEGHGREAPFGDVDVTRTIGWFTTFVPVRLHLGGTENWPAMLKTVQAQLQRMPNGGIGYGVLRHLAADVATAARLRAQPQPEICLNYLGQLDHTAPEPAPARRATEPTGPCASPRGARRHLLRLDAQVEDGRLQVRLQYSAHRHRPATMKTLARGFIENLRALAARCEAGAIARLPSDRFSLARLQRDELGKIAKLIETRRTP